MFDDVGTIGTLTGLTHLDLHDGPFDDLMPDCLLELSSIRELDLQYQSCPFAEGCLHACQVLLLILQAESWAFASAQVAPAFGQLRFV